MLLSYNYIEVSYLWCILIKIILYITCKKEKEKLTICIGYIINKDENVHRFGLSAIRGELFGRDWEREKEREREKRESERERKI